MSDLGLIPMALSGYLLAWLFQYYGNRKAEKQRHSGDSSE